MENIVFDINQIQEIIPHRPPFLLVDRVVEFHEGERVVCEKAVTINEPFFVGHFPGKPVMPGVLVLEAMAQTGAILALKSSDGPGLEKILYLVGAKEVKWKRMVVPGDTLRIEAKFIKRRGRFWSIDANATVQGEVVAQGELMAMAG
jgi:3-hydroxyacyl-[acyl-carrier-protein] dehydratase